MNRTVTRVGKKVAHHLRAQVRANELRWYVFIRRSIESMCPSYSLPFVVQPSPPFLDFENKGIASKSFSAPVTVSGPIRAPVLVVDEEVCASE